jgi:hypothetical protein
MTVAPRLARPYLLAPACLQHATDLVDALQQLAAAGKVAADSLSFSLGSTPLAGSPSKDALTGALCALCMLCGAAVPRPQTLGRLGQLRCSLAHRQSRPGCRRPGLEPRRGHGRGGGGAAGSSGLAAAAPL